MISTIDTKIEEPEEISEVERYLLSEKIVPEDYFELTSRLFSAQKQESEEPSFGLPTDLRKETGLSLNISRKIVLLWNYARKNDDYFERRM